MDIIRFLHCADLHLGAEFSSLGGLAPPDGRSYL